MTLVSLVDHTTRQIKVSPKTFTPSSSRCNHFPRVTKSVALERVPFTTPHAWRIHKPVHTPPFNQGKTTGTFPSYSMCSEATWRPPHIASFPQLRGSAFLSLKPIKLCSVFKICTAPCPQILLFRPVFRDKAEAPVMYCTYLLASYILTP